MGAVYRARDTRLDRDVAIKVSTTEFSERFSREARSIAALNHSNVCHLYEVGANYLVLEYVEGETLRGLFFLGGDDRIMVVSYTLEGNSFSNGRPRPWSPTPVLRTGTLQNFDVSHDGKRVVMFPRAQKDETEGPLHATVLLNFFDELRRRIP